MSQENENKDKEKKDIFKDVVRRFRGSDTLHLTIIMKISIILFYIVTILMALRIYGVLIVFFGAAIIAIAAGFFFRENSRRKEVKIAILMRAFIILPGPVQASVLFGSSCGLFALVLATVVTILWCKQDIAKMEQW